MEKLKEYSAIIEEGLKILGVKPEDTRGDEPGQWLVFNGETEIYIDLWEQKEMTNWQYFKPEGHNTFVFQVLSPVCKLPKSEQLKTFYEDILHYNLNMLFASFTINTDEQMLAAKFRRIGSEMRVEDVIEAIESVGYYSEVIGKVLSEKYATPRIALNPPAQ